MGRRKDSPEVQKAKGYPSRTKAKTDAALKAKASGPTAEETLLASMDIAGLRPPARFARKEFKEERDVWMTVAPRLKATLRASTEFGPALVAYCDAVARYNRCVLALRREGYVVKVKTVAGDYMPRSNPNEKVRQQALAEILQLSDRFGFTPRDNFALLIDQRRVLEGGMGGGHTQGDLGLNDDPAPGQTPAAAADPVGGMDRFDSAPPGTLHS